MKRKLGICAHCLHGVSELDAMQYIKAAGFDCTFIAAWQPDTVKQLVQEAARLELPIESIHAPFTNINEIWLAEEDPEIFHKMWQTIDSAGENGIPIVVLHVSSGWTPAVTERGLDRFDRLVAHAKEKGVIAAFENLRTTGITAYFADRYYYNDEVGFCHDCGHEHCYTKTVCWPDIFTTKLCCTHIHDNFSRPLEDRTCNPDIHLLPFEGTYDYAQMMRKYEEYGYEGTLMMEVFQHRPEHQAFTKEEYLKTCYERLVRISQM